MPEGDTVWRHARQLHEALAGARLTGSDFRLPALATADLTGWTVREAASRGKHLLIRLTGAGRPRTLHSHLRMDGSWRIFRPGEPWRGGPGHTVRIVLTTDAATAVGYRLHDVELVPTAREASVVGHLGPDLLGADWDLTEAVRRLRAVPDRPLAAALLDQRNLAGIGNLYACELAFLAGVSPWTPIGEVADLTALVDRAHRLLHTNRESWAQVTTGSSRPGEANWVHGRAGRPCRRCGTRVRQAPSTRGIDARVTFWCPRCQPGPVPGPGLRGA